MLQPSAFVMDQFKQIEVPLKFKIATEDLEVRSEDYKSLEMPHKK